MKLKEAPDKYKRILLNLVRTTLSFARALIPDYCNILIFFRRSQLVQQAHARCHKFSKK